LNPDEAIVNPFKGKHPPAIGPLAVMVATETDLKALLALHRITGSNSRKLYTSRLYVNRARNDGFSFTGPMMGAPYAAMLLESLIVWGAKKIIFVGWCGSIDHHLTAGDIILPTEAVIEEGTSRLYQHEASSTVKASDAVTASIRGALKQTGCPYREGKVWTTDAIYRETIGKVKSYQRQQVLAVEMELSALISVGRFRDIDVGALLVVSDELGEYQWRPGFRDERFLKGRHAMYEVIKTLCQKN
jgi:uridine phosphorylase